MRKFKTVTIPQEEGNRDAGKSFLVVEKNAWDAEKWATRALLALSRSGVEVDDATLASGAVGLLMVGMDGLRKLPFEDAEPLLDEMTGCIHYVPNPSAVDPMTNRPATRPLSFGDDFNDGDVSEISTLWRLRQEVLELHLGFSIAAVISQLTAAVRSSSQQSSQTSPEPADA